MESFGFRSPYCTCSHHHYYGRPEPWSRQRTIATWLVSGVCVVALAIGLPLVRNGNERSWCSSSGEGATSQQCLADQKAIRCGPLGILHCPAGGD